jgi:glycosyltransferase involved in cell wall biosynthesis
MPMRQNRELVSVVIPTYNSENFVAHAIDSVIGQTYPRIEIIVVDDGSRDDTVAVARAKLQKDFKSRWQVLELGSNQGPSNARNVGLREAQGSWIQFLDSDDWLAPRKFELQMAVAKHAPADVAVLYSPWSRGTINVKQAKQEGPLITPKIEGKAPIMCLVSPCRPLHSAGLTRRTVLEHIRGYDESLRFWECEEINFRLAKNGRFKFVPSNEPLYFWRLHPDKIYIGGPEARYRSTNVALGWIELLLRATENQPIDTIKLPNQDLKYLWDECTMWGRLLYAQDREAFKKYMLMAKILNPHFRPTKPLHIKLLSKYIAYERAEAVARITRIPRYLARVVLTKLSLRKQTAIFDWQ